MKRGPGAGPRDARYCHSACTGHSEEHLSVNASTLK